MVLRFVNGSYLSADGRFIKGDVWVREGVIFGLGSVEVADESVEVIDLKGNSMIPGLIDIHVHGGVGYDVMASTPEEIQHIANAFAKEGTTSFLPTTITAGMEEIKKTLANIKETSVIEADGASIEGVHIEGPFISPKQKGCHDISKMLQPEGNYYDEFREIMGDLKIHITTAPEIEGALEFIRYVSSQGGSITIGHTDGTLEEINRGIEAGAVSFTHLFNCMRGIHHREPGGAGGALANGTFVELICDGIHVHPDVVKLVYGLKGKERIVLVTDAMQAAGLGDGDYSFGGFTIRVVDGIARKEDGTLASSTLSMWKAVKNMQAFTGASFEEAVQMATLNPAKVIGIDQVVGSIEPGKRADLLVVDANEELVSVYCRGKRVR